MKKIINNLNKTTSMGLMKIFSGSEILALALQEKIEAINVKTIVKNNIQSIGYS